MCDLLRTVHRRLTAQLLKHLGGTGESVARFANGDIEHEFLDLELAHWVAALVFAGGVLRAIGLLVGGLSFCLRSCHIVSQCSVSAASTC